MSRAMEKPKAAVVAPAVRIVPPLPQLTQKEADAVWAEFKNAPAGPGVRK